ncbi:hypothetical protein OIU78_009961 [Salix suchowensis]|nr:hypothetical protein OIU78_009961 [Salix suchowensis]
MFVRLLETHVYIQGASHNNEKAQDNGAGTDNDDGEKNSCSGGGDKDFSNNVSAAEILAGKMLMWKLMKIWRRELKTPLLKVS